jgi:HEAT repeat protein
VTSAYDSATQALTLTVQQTQVDTAKADSSGFRSVTPLAFRAPIAIRVGTEKGDVVRRVTIDRREQTARLDDLPAPPTMVAFDDGNAIVKTLTFDQPTAWLAALLERHFHLWHRAWAIDQLAARTGDRWRARSSGARGADYFLTRAHAAGALGRFSEAVALPALEAAARDTSAQVRAAAMSALGTLGGERALAIARDAWRSDSSYQVRAGALLVLVRLGGRDAREAVRRGLETPSYRDVIQNAAIAAIVQQPDSELIGALARQAGAQPLPTIALAALTARGDSTARRALLESLDDARGWVRAWSLEAVEGQLEPEDALAVLRDAVGGLRRPEARAAVREAIGRLERRHGAEGRRTASCLLTAALQPDRPIRSPVDMARRQRGSPSRGSVRTRSSPPRRAMAPALVPVEASGVSGVVSTRPATSSPASSSALSVSSAWLIVPSRSTPTTRAAAPRVRASSTTVHSHVIGARSPPAPSMSTTSRGAGDSIRRMSASIDRPPRPPPRAARAGRRSGAAPSAAPCPVASASSTPSSSAAVASAHPVSTGSRDDAPPGRGQRPAERAAGQVLPTSVSVPVMRCAFMRRPPVSPRRARPRAGPARRR